MAEALSPALYLASYKRYVNRHAERWLGLTLSDSAAPEQIVEAAESALEDNGRLAYLLHSLPFYDERFYEYYLLKQTERLLAAHKVLFVMQMDEIRFNDDHFHRFAQIVQQHFPSPGPLPYVPLPSDTEGCQKFWLMFIIVKPRILRPL